MHGKTTPIGWLGAVPLALLPAVPVGTAAADFSVDRAMAHVRYLSDEIGPRKTGTGAEDRAVRYVEESFRGAGLEVEILPVEAVNRGVGRVVVARTRNVIARLPGSGPGRILIGAHHDSRNREVPGALDDASGAAVVLELARVFSSRPPSRSLLFAVFGAEEEGCVGSRHFVDTVGADGLDLVVTLDPVGRGKVFVAPFPDPPALGWVRAVYRIGRRRGLGSAILTDPIYAVAPRFLSVPHLADHAPFVEAGVPALNISCQFDLWEYHTIYDRSDRVQPQTLAAAATVVEDLVRGFDAGELAPRDDPHYLILRFPGFRLFLPSGVMSIAGFATLAGVFLLGVRRLRDIRPVSFSMQILRCGAAVGVTVSVALSGLFLSEAVAEQLAGFRFPWFARQGLSLGMALALTGVTTWLGLRIFRRIQPAVEPGPYVAAAGLILLVELAVCLAVRVPEVAFLFVPPLIGLAVAVQIRRPGAAMLVAVVGYAHLPGLLLPSTFRAALRFAGLEIPASVGFGVLVLLALPPALTVLGLSYHPDLLGGRWWRALVHPNLLLACLVGYAACLGAWIQQVSYTDEHRRTVRVRQEIDLDKDRTIIDLASQEYLRGIRIRRPEPDTIDLKNRKWRQEVDPPGELLRWTAEESPDPEATRAVRLLVELERPANSLRVRFRSPGGFLLPGTEAEDGEKTGWTEVRSPEWRYVHQLDRLEERYRLWPVAPENPLTVEVEVGYEEDLLGWRFEAPHTVFYHRNLVRDARTLPGLGEISGDRRQSGPATADGTR